jgi:predicted short-subunit dehydrogenase-like oxidoreductase (DUF2520 family)
MKAAVVGVGRVGLSFAHLLSKEGIELLCIYDIDNFAAERAAEITGALNINDWQQFKKTSKKADLIIITTPDDLIEETAEKLEAAEDQYLMHMSGLLGADILPKNIKGAFSIHPLCSVSSFSEGTELLADALFTLEGSTDSLDFAKKLAEKLKVEYITIQAEFKPLYHAAAVLASNYLLTLINESFALLESAGLNSDQLRKAVIELSRGTLNNIEELGIEKALTGPIARSDLKTIKKHQQSIKQYSPEELELYQILGRYTLELISHDDELEALFREVKKGGK